MIWITIGFIIFLVLCVIAANLGYVQVLFPIIYQIPGGDKLGHFFLMGLLSFLVNSVLPTRKINLSSQKVPLGSLLVIIVVSIEEASQIFLEYRAFSFLDLLFDYMGIILFGFLANYLYFKKHVNISAD